jgi:hypothetical protein
MTKLILTMEHELYAYWLDNMALHINIYTWKYCGVIHFVKKN